MNINALLSNPWVYWPFRFCVNCLKMLLGCLVGFPILIYLAIPSILWIFLDIPYKWPAGNDLMKWVRYGLACTLWVGSVIWLSEFLPWLFKVIRSRGN